MSMVLSGQAAIVTGGGSGIGKAIAEALARAGAHVVITGRRASVLEAAVQDMPGKAHFRVHDVTDLNAHGPLVDDVEGTVGPLSILVNNAGRHLKAPFADTAAEDLRGVIETNLVGAFALTQACVRKMAERRHGSVLMISSMAGLMGLPMVPVYSLTKAGLLGLTRSLAVELGPAGIRVNAICPGFIDTEMFRRATAGDPGRRARIEGRIPLPSLGSPDDVGAAAAFLCSDSARYITGVTIPVDGGFVTGF